MFVVRPDVRLSGPNGTIREGESANLTCVIEKGLPKPKVFWYKNETFLKDERGTSLILTDVKDEDKGLYKCEARNPGGVANDILNVIIDGKS